MEAPIPFETSMSNVLNLAYWTLIAPMIVDDEEMLMIEVHIKMKINVGLHLRKLFRYSINTTRCFIYQRTIHTICNRTQYYR